jgi:hypothetical protein
VSFIVPLLIASILIHDVQIFLIPFHFVITWQVFQEREEKAQRYTLLPYAPVVAASLLPVIFHGTKDVAIAVCNSWHALIDEFQLCRVNSQTFGHLSYSGIKALGWDMRWPISSSQRVLQNHQAASLFLIAFLLSVLPYLIFYRLSSLYRNVKTRGLRRFWYLAPVSLLTPLALFFIGGWDFGRWIHLITAALFAVTFSNPQLVRCRVPFDEVLDRAKFKELLPYLLLILLYVAYWYVPHCCEPSSIYGGPSSIYGGLFEAVGASYRLLFGG